MPLALKAKLADVVIDNGGNQGDLEREVKGKVFGEILVKLGYIGNEHDE